MTDNDKALVERLRDDWPEILVEKHWMMDSDAIEEQRKEAADRIEAQAAEIAELKSWKAAEDAHHHKLRAEIERLREALREVLEEWVADYDPLLVDEILSRAALGETE